MKKLTCLLLLAALLLGLTACVSRDPKKTSSSDGPTLPPETLSALTPEQAKQIAESLVKHSVNELYARIGYPLSSSYSSSCSGPGEDGELNYEGFSVFTYREEGREETITYVYGSVPPESP